MASPQGAVTDDQRASTGPKARLLDAKGLICPLPVLKARKILLRLPAGEWLRVMVTDPHAPADFALFCRETGHVLGAVTPVEGGAEIMLQSSGLS